MRVSLNFTPITGYKPYRKVGDRVQQGLVQLQIDQMVGKMEKTGFTPPSPEASGGNDASPFTDGVLQELKHTEMV